jgi:hypothetical protein
MAHLLPATVIAHLPAATTQVVLGHRFFPGLIAPPFMDGLRDAFYVSMAMAVVAAIASLLRGRQYFYQEQPAPTAVLEGETTPLTPPPSLEKRRASVGTPESSDGV